MIAFARRRSTIYRTGASALPGDQNPPIQKYTLSNPFISHLTRTLDKYPSPIIDLRDRDRSLPPFILHPHPSSPLPRIRPPRIRPNPSSPHMHHQGVPRPSRRHIRHQPISIAVNPLSPFRHQALDKTTHETRRNGHRTTASTRTFTALAHSMPDRPNIQPSPSDYPLPTPPKAGSF